MGNFRDILLDERANAAVTDFIARKIRQRVEDPRVADKLIPKDHGFGTRRVQLESGYFEVYNRDDVRLVDLNETPIERITPNGVKTSEGEHEFDILVYTTGFDGVTGAFDRIDIRGPGEVKLKDVWADGPRTCLGWQPEGFPNLLMVLGPHTAAGNIPRAVEHGVECLAGLLEFMRANDYKRVETRPEQVADWTQIVIKASEPLLSSKVDPGRPGSTAMSKAVACGASWVTTAMACTTGASATRSPAAATASSRSVRDELPRPKPIHFRLPRA